MTLPAPHDDTKKVAWESQLAGMMNSGNYKDIAKAIYERNAELVKLDKMKDEFVSIVSHELRTPLTIIKNYLWLVANEDKGEVGENPMKKIMIAMHSVDRLTLLVEDTLTVSRLENGKISLKKETFDIVKKMEYIIEIYGVKYKEKNIKVAFIPEEPKIDVTGDANRIHEVLVNIFSNAIKFTPNGGQVTIVVGRNAESNSCFVNVKDSGPGIPKAKQSKLFTKFGKIEESYTNMPNVNGTGLGLYISQEIAKLHGGKIDVISESGQGSTFSLILPIDAEQKVENSE